MVSFRTIRAIALTAIGVLVLSACANSSPRQPCPPGDRCLLLGNGSDPNTLDPAKATGTWEDRILSDMYMGLTQSDPQGRPIPAMATHWETSADGLTWTFHLRTDALWSDGVPVTADDFVFSLRRVMSPQTASEYAYLLYFIKNARPVNIGEMPINELGVRAVDPHTLEIRLEHPAPYLPEVAKHQTMFPVPRHIVERYGDAWATQVEHYVTNGPYVLQAWRLGNYVRLRRNPRFWDANTLCFDQIEFYPSADSVASERRVRNGEIDSNSDISSTRMPRLRREIPNYVRVHTYLGISYMAFNRRIPAFRDARVRQAFSMAIDREFIAQHLLVDGRIPAYTFVPPGIANYSPPPPPEWSHWPYERRKAEARRLMMAAGYTREHPLRVRIYQASNPDAALVAQAIQSDMADIGIRLQILQQDTQVTYAMYRARNFDVAGAGWIADFNDAANFLDLQRSQTGAQNYGDYNNPRFDALMDRADHEPDAARRADYMRQAEAIMLADMPVVPISFSVNKNLVNPRITGWVDNIVDQHRNRWLCERGATPRAAPQVATAPQAPAAH